MSKKILYLLIPISMLACNFLIPSSRQENTPPQISTIAATSPGPASDQPTLSAPDVTSTSSFTIVRIHTQDGELLTQLSAQTQKAKELNQKPFIEFDATWCPPCQAIDSSLKAKDPLTIKAFEGIYLIRADVDEWGWGDGKDFKFDAIPIYYQLDDSGNSTGASVNGGAWGEDIPENFSPILDAFFHTP